MNEMNYRYNYPDTSLSVDAKIAECFVNKERTKEQIERFMLFASMSKEKDKINQILQNENDKNIDENIMQKVA